MLAVDLEPPGILRGGGRSPLGALCAARGGRWQAFSSPGAMPLVARLQTANSDGAVAKLNWEWSVYSILGQTPSLDRMRFPTLVGSTLRGEPVRLLQAASAIDSQVNSFPGLLTGICG